MTNLNTLSSLDFSVRQTVHYIIPDYNTKFTPIATKFPWQIIILSSGQVHMPHYNNKFICHITFREAHKSTGGSAAHISTMPSLKAHKSKAFFYLASIASGPSPLAPNAGAWTGCQH
jgi:hypothetical protein